MAEPTSPPARRPETIAAVLGLLIVASATVRSVAGWRHSVPRLFPDEYIYAALGRSLGHGQLQIRGETVHFPGILEPLLAAPIWRSFSVITAYHLVQVENAIVASLVAIPLYWLARSLRLSQTYSLFVALYGLVLPELVLTAFTSSDAVAYPFAIGAVAVAVVSLNEPTSRRQVAFIVLALLATLARVEYFALAPAYLVAAVVLDRREAWHRHRVAISALVPVFALAALFAFGYYLTGPQGVALHTNYVSWFFVQLFLVAIVLGVAIVPGALAGLISARTRLEVAFAVFFGAFSLLVLIASTKPGAEKQEFKERYLFALAALVPIAYGFYVRHAKPLRGVVIGVAACLAVAAARLPLTQYATSTFKTDSQFLFAISESQSWLGSANSSLIVALLATLAALVAVVVAFRGNAAIPFAVSIVVGLAAATVATHVDIRITHRVRNQLPADLTWVDHAARGQVTAIETPQAVKQDLLYQLYWNTSIQREVLLGSANATDTFSAPHLRIGANGELENVHGDVLFHDYGATGVLANARPIASKVRFTLWQTNGMPRLRYVIPGRFWDGWLAESGRLRAWPRAGNAVRLSFRLGLPSNFHRPLPVVTIGGLPVTVGPGEAVSIACTSKGGALDTTFSAKGGWLAPDFRRLSLRMTHVVIADAPPRVASGRACAVISR